MSTSTTNMGLTIWSDLADFYNHTDLINNFTALDVHDHSSGKGAQIGNAGIAPLAIATGQVQDSAITTAKIANANVTDDKLGNPNNSVYKTIASGSATIPGSTVAATYLMTPQGSIVASNTATAAGSFPVPRSVWLGSTDYVVSGLLPKFRLRAFAACNNQWPTVNFAIALSTVSTYGGNSGNFSTLVGSAVAGSGVTLTLTSGSANTYTQNTGTDFAGSFNQPLVFTIIPSGATNAASVTQIFVQLQYHHS